MPRAHLDQVEWTPERLTELGEEDGAADRGARSRRSWPRRPTRSRASRRASGSCGWRSSTRPERIERAAARALHFRTLNSGSVASILKNNLDQLPLPGDEPQQALPLHENIRGGGYYH